MSGRPRKQQRPRGGTQPGLSLTSAEQEALRQSIASWDPSSIYKGALFQELGSVSVADVAARAFVDPGLSPMLVDLLSEQARGYERAASTALSGTVALNAARPDLKIDAQLPLAGVGQQLAVVSESLTNIAARTAESMTAPFASGIADVIAGAQEAMEPWRAEMERAAAAIERLVEHQREMDERTDAFVRRHGWPVPTTISGRGYHRIMSMVGRPKREVNGFMVRSFRPGTRAYSAAREVVEQSSYFSPRRPLLRQVWRAQKRGDWYLVINGLLPLVEGVLVDAMFSPKATRPRAGWTKGVERLRAKVDVPFGDAPVRAIEALLISGGAGLALYEDYEPPPGVEPRVLNRHGVLHGIARRYGTEQNAVRLFLVLVLMAECFELLDIPAEHVRGSTR
jgi:hypothetical protein